MWLIKGHNKKCHTLIKDGKWQWHICPDMLQLQGQKNKTKQKSEEMLPLHQTLSFVSTGLWHGSTWISPPARQPWSCKTWGCVWEVLPSRSGTAGLTSSSTLDVHGNPAKAACHLLRTFVKVVKQPWQQTQRQQQQKGAGNTPWICFIKCSFIWF